MSNLTLYRKKVLILEYWEDTNLYESLTTEREREEERREREGGGETRESVCVFG